MLISAIRNKNKQFKKIDEPSMINANQIQILPIIVKVLFRKKPCLRGYYLETKELLIP